MTITLKRKQIFIISSILLCSCILFTRMDFLLFGETTTGKVPNYRAWARGSFYAEPIIFFTINSQTIHCELRDTDGLNDELIPIVYLPSDPEQLMIYNFAGFWLEPLLGFMMPYVIFILPLIFGYMNEKDLLVIRSTKWPWIQKMNKYKFAEERFKELSG